MASVIPNDIFSDFIENSRDQLIARLEARDPSKRVRSAMSPTHHEKSHHNGKYRWNASEMAELLIQRDPVGDSFLLEMLSIGRDLFFRRLTNAEGANVIVDIPYAVQ